MAEDEEKPEDEEKKEKPPEAKPITLPPSKEAESAPPPEQPPPGYGPPPAYGPPPEPFFRANNLQKILAFGLLFGIIILLVGAILSASSGFISVDPEDDLDDQKDDQDLIGNLAASGQLVGAIGLFIIALFVILPLLQINDLSDKQRKLLMLLMMAVIIGFAFLTTNMFNN